MYSFLFFFKLENGEQCLDGEQRIESSKPDFSLKDLEAVREYIAERYREDTGRNVVKVIFTGPPMRLRQ